MSLQRRALLLAAAAVHCWLLGQPLLLVGGGLQGGAQPAALGLWQARPWPTARGAGAGWRRRRCLRSRTCSRASRRDGAGRGNPFDILGLPRGAELAEVRPAFRALAATLHPDIPGTGDEAAFRTVLWAYQELSDPLRQRRWVGQPRRRRVQPVEVPVAGAGAYVENWEELFEEDVPAQPRRQRDTALDEWEELLRQAELRDAKEQARENWWTWESWQKEQSKATRPDRSAKDEARRLVQGVYKAQGGNHNRPVYWKQSTEVGKDIMIYYWDGRDGAEYSGWWIGPKVGAVTVFAYSDVHAATPPTSGWRVPPNGPVDTAFRLSIEAGSLEIGFAEGS